MKRAKHFITILMIGFFFIGKAQNNFTFKVIPLGVKGGLDESNLSSYLVGTKDSENYISLDAGTIRSGIQKAIELGSIHNSPNHFLRHNIAAYLISHAHTDHVAGLIINSPADSIKNIYALPSVIEVLKTHYFTPSSWANFADAGEKPILNKYHYKTLGIQDFDTIQNTNFKVKTFSLSHGKDYESSAFLVENKGNYILYLGDTGADRIENSDKLNILWKDIAHLIDNNALKAIFIEVSFPNSQSDTQLYGHLKPQLLLEELSTLQNLTKNKNLNGLKIVVTHIKPSEGAEEKIKAELLKNNTLNIQFIFPEQGKWLYFN